MRTARSRLLAAMLGVTTAVTLGSALQPAESFAAPGPQGCARHPASMSSAAKKQRAHEVGDAIVAALRAGSTAQQVDDKLGSMCVVDKSGIGKVGGVSPASSTPSQINVSAPQVLYDEPSDLWYVYARWDWNTMDGIESEVPSCGNLCNVGGNDGFAIALSRPVNSVLDYYSQEWGDSPHFYPTGRMTVSMGSTAGVSFIGQDHYCDLAPSGGSCTARAGQWDDYDFLHGMLFYDIDNVGCGTLQAFSQYSHTWNSTAVSGISVGYPLSISVTLSSQSNQWPQGSQPSNSVNPSC